MIVLYVGVEEHKIKLKPGELLIEVAAQLFSNEIFINEAKRI